MQEPAACGERAAQHSRRHTLPAETAAKGTDAHMNVTASETATTTRATDRFENHKFIE
jgi:hypothetical protein